MKEVLHLGHHGYYKDGGHTEQGLSTAVRLPELDQLVDLWIVSSHYKHREKDAQYKVDGVCVDDDVVDVRLPVQGDVAQSTFIQHLVVHEVWERDPDREEKDKEGIRKHPGLSWAPEENPAHHATGLGGEGVHHRNVPVDADHGHHHHGAGLQHLLERVEEVDVEGRVQVRVDRRHRLRPSLESLDQGRQLLDEEQEDVGGVEVGEDDQQPVEVGDDPPVLQDVDGDQVAWEACQGDEEGGEEDVEAHNALAVPPRVLHERAAVVNRVEVVSDVPALQVFTWVAAVEVIRHPPCRLSTSLDAILAIRRRPGRKQPTILGWLRYESGV